MANVDKPPLLTFQAELKQVASRKSASLDMVYKVVLETDQSDVMTLGQLSADTLLNVSVEVAS